MAERCDSVTDRGTSLAAASGMKAAHIVLRGGIGGLMGTLAMTAFLLVARAIGLLHIVAPREITGRAEAKAGVPPQQLPEPAFQASWLLAHFGYGVGVGAIYAALRAAIPGGREGSSQRELPAGMAYGLLLWAGSYLGVMPLLGLYPFPTETSTSQTACMIAAHEVYGAMLGIVEARLP